MATWLFRLEMIAPLHVGDHGIRLEEAQDYIPSDTLFSALLTAWAQLPGEEATVDGLQAAFASYAPLLLTSAFPYAGEVRFFPKPQLQFTPTVRRSSLPVPGGADDALESGKEYKGVRWVSESVFNDLTQLATPARLEQLWKQAELLQDGQIWVSAGEAALLRKTYTDAYQNDVSLWGSQRAAKVTVDRATNASALFHVGRHSFQAGCGLWFMAHADDEWLNRIQRALGILADQGMGGQRSRGNGQFKVVEVKEVSPLPAGELLAGESKPAYGVLLSRFAPKTGEMHLLRREHAAYTLNLVGGYNGTPGDAPVIRRQVRLLAEGSIIGMDAGAAPGNLVDVTPANAPKQITHAIYRYGYGFLAPVQLQDGGAP